MDVFPNLRLDFPEEGIVNQFLYDSMLVRLRNAIFLLVFSEEFRIKEIFPKTSFNSLWS